MKRALSALLALLLFVAPVFADVKPVKGFDKKVYDGALALYASSHMLGVRDRFICTVQAFRKTGDGYLLLGAGHCTPANAEELPPDMEFSVAENIGGSLTPVVLVQSVFDPSHSRDFAEYYLRTDKKYSVTELGDESDARIGDKTVNVNYSLGLNKFVSYGRVSSEVQTSGEMKGFFGVDEFDSHGASGSAVIDERTKKVIGIVIAGVDGTTTAAWVEPISGIRKALERKTLPRSTKPYVAPQSEKYVPEPDVPLPQYPGVVFVLPEPQPPAGCVRAKQAKIVNGLVVEEHEVLACQAKDGHWFDGVTGEPF